MCYKMLAGFRLSFLIVMFSSISFERPLITWEVLVADNQHCYVPLKYISGPEFDCHKTDYQEDSYNETHVSFHINSIAQCDALIDNVIKAALNCYTVQPSVVTAPSLSGTSLKGKLLKNNETFN
nr:uncharacterized protein LOC111423773 [Onthophagus taurus]